jgi:hypothetical protein
LVPTRIGNSAQAVIRAQLFVNDTLVPVSSIDKTHLQLVFTDIEGVDTVLTENDLRIHADKYVTLFYTTLKLQRNNCEV